MRAPVTPAPTTPRPLLFLPTSAYQASIAIDDEAVYVLAPTAVHRIVVGKSTESFPRELGSVVATSAEGFVYWSGGKFFEAPKASGDPRELGAVPHRPQRLAAARDRLVWIDEAAGKFSLHTLEAARPRQLYASPGALDALALLGDDAYFVERLSPKSWRIGRAAIGSLALRGHDVRYTPEQRGRSPSQLAAFGDALYFQDPSGYQVIELSRDLERERTLAKDLVCSPLAVWEQVYCAQVEGLVEVRGKGRPARLLAPNSRGLITALAASPKAIAWLSDAGENQLTVKWLARE